MFGPFGPSPAGLGKHPSSAFFVEQISQYGYNGMTLHTIYPARCKTNNPPSLGGVNRSIVSPCAVAFGCRSASFCGDLPKVTPNPNPDRTSFPCRIVSAPEHLFDFVANFFLSQFVDEKHIKYAPRDIMGGHQRPMETETCGRKSSVRA
jgi:hypothetical protein